MFFLLYKHADEAVFDDFRKISDHFRKISEDFPKLFQGQTNVSEHFQRLPKIAEDDRRRSKDVSIIDSWRDKREMLSNMISSHVGILETRFSILENRNLSLKMRFSILKNFENQVSSRDCQLTFERYHMSVSNPLNIFSQLH